MKKGRGSSYPSMPLGEAVSKLRKVSAELGQGSGGRMAVLQALGYKGESGTSGRAIATLGYFNLLDKRSDNSYTVSKLGLKILFPETDSNAEAVAQAALSPELYKKLHERYKGLQVPTELKNTLIHSYGINISGAGRAAKDFIDSMTYAGLLSPDRKLQSLGSEQDTEDTEDGDKQEADKPAGTAGIPKSMQILLAPARELPSGIVIAFPKDLDAYVAFGEFGEALRMLEEKAIELNGEKSDEKERSSSV